MLERLILIFGKEVGKRENQLAIDNLQLAKAMSNKQLKIRLLFPIAHCRLLNCRRRMGYQAG